MVDFLSTALAKELLSGFFLYLAVLYLGRGEGGGANVLISFCWHSDNSFSGKFEAQKVKKLKKFFFLVYLWFEPQSSLKLLDNGRKYRTGVFGVSPITGLGFRAQKLFFCVLQQ